MFVTVMIVNVWWGDWTLLHTSALFDGTNVDVSNVALFVLCWLIRAGRRLIDERIQQQQLA